MANRVEITVPDIGDFDEVEIIEILVAEGQSVAAEDPLISLESDKATMDIPAPADGTVAKVLVKVGQMVAQGTPIVLLNAGDEVAVAEEKNAPAKDTQKIIKENVAPKPASKPASKPDAETKQTDQPTPSHANDNNAPPVVANSTQPNSTQHKDTARAHASPAIRRFARELGADLAQISGGGPKGRILKADVKAWIKARLNTPASAPSSAQPHAANGIPPIPEIDFSKFGTIEVLPLSRIQKISGQHLQRAWLNIPHVTHHDEADITELEAFRQSLKAEAAKDGIRITLLGFVIKILASALKKFPTFNASLHADGVSLVIKKYYNIGIAVDTPHGLVVPVIREVERKSISDLAKEMGELSLRARQGKLKPDDLQGGCMSISSLGGIGGSAFTPIVNAPEVAILGLTRARMMPRWDGTNFQPRLMLPLDLSYNHRAIDGAEAARFVAFLVESFGDVRRLAL